MRKIDKVYFDQAYDLFHEVFILAELRPYAKMKKLFDENQFVIYEMTHLQEMIGAMIVWELSEYIYIENFAVSEKARNQGIGSTMIKQIQDIYPNHLLVLEVEKPHDEYSRRRVTFYQRNHFLPNDNCHYIQPPLREHSVHIDLMLMSYPHALTEEVFKRIKKEIFENVYQQK